MSMIISELFDNLCLAPYYFQHDSLWKSMEISSNSRGTHDVYDQKGVSSEMGKSAQLFSMGYRQENPGSLPYFGAEPTIFMMEKDLRTHRHFPASSYVAENKPRSSLAQETNAGRTHDMFEGKWFSMIWRSSSASYDLMLASLCLASSVALGN
jgi:hypothetical protein